MSVEVVSNAQLLAQVAALRAENEALKARGNSGGKSLKLSKTGKTAILWGFRGPGKGANLTRPEIDFILANIETLKMLREQLPTQEQLTVIRQTERAIGA